MSIRRATLRAASASLAIASVFLLATCDLDKLTKPNDGGIGGNPFDSTELTLNIAGTTTVGTTPTIPLLGTGTMSVTSSTVTLANVVTRYYSALPGIISVDSMSGVITGAALGTAKVTAKILAPELGAGITTSKNVRVRYKGIKVITPVLVDSLTGLGQTRTASIQGTNNNNVVIAGALVADSLRMRTGAGVIDTSSIRIGGVSGTTLTAKKSGTAYLVAFFDGLRDSVAVKVRQVAKSITFPTTDFTAKAVNFNMTVPLTVKDVQDSVIPTPTITWSTKDTVKATITAAGVLRVKSTASDTVIATSDTVTRKQRIIVAQVPASMTKFQGDARSDTVAKNVTVVPTVTVLDSGSTLIAGASVQFKTGIGLNASVNDTLPVITNAQGRAAPTSWKIGDVAGTNNNTLIATSGAATTTFTVSGIAGQPKKLGFSVSPTSAQIGFSIAPAIKVAVQDSLGNTITTATNSITLAISNNPGAATLTGTVTASAVAGIATFSNISLNTGGAGYTLQASAAGLTSGISNGFDIFGAATKLTFTTQPVGTSAGAPMSNVRVTVQDASGATVSSSSASITMSISANPGGSTLGGTTTVSAVNGVATFSTLSLNNASGGYSLAANAAGLAGAVSNTFTVAAVGAASKLAFGVQPTNVVAGASIAPAMTVRVLDANGALVTGSTQQITLSIESSSPTGGTISGTTSQNAVSGVATFNNISINKAGTAFKLLATGTGSSLTTATSSSFDVSTGTATKLGFVQQPLHTVAGSTIAPAVTVELQDASGNRVTGGTAVSVTIALQGGTCAGATLTGAGSQNTASGVATFSALSIATTVNNCALTATASSLTSVNSASFNSVASNGAARLTFTTEPSASANAGSALLTAPVVNIQDAAGNNVTASSSVSMTLSLLAGSPQTSFTSGTTSPAATTTSATFPNLILNTAGSYRFVVSASGYRTDTSQIVTISPAAIARVNFTTQPSNIVAGVPFSPVVVATVQDNFGNTVAGSTNTLSLNVQLAAAPFTSYRFNDNSFNYAVTAVNGVATFTGLSVINAATAIKLNVFSTGLSGSTSSLFDVSAGPLSKLGFTVQPPSADTVGTIITPSLSTNIQVAGQDSVGNTISDFSNAVTVALTGGTAGATLSGTKTAGPAAGVATFSDLSIDRTGTGYQLSASASGVSTATSIAFAIDPLFLNTANVCCQKLVVLGSTVYFVHNGALKSVPVTGGTITTIQASTNASHLATDGTNIYWAERGVNNSGDAFVKKYAPGVGVSTLTVALTDLMTDDGARMYADATTVYFISRNIGNNGYALKTVPNNASSATPTQAYDITNFSMPYMTVSGGLIYFYDGLNGVVRRVQGTGGSLTTLSTSVTAQRLALSGTTLYFSDGVAIKSIPSATTASGAVTPTPVFTAPATVYEMAANGTNLYFNFDGSIRRYATSDFSTFALLNTSAVQTAANFDFDGAGLYFMHNFGRLARVPK